MKGMKIIEVNSPEEVSSSGDTEFHFQFTLEYDEIPVTFIRKVTIRHHRRYDRYRDEEPDECWMEDDEGEKMSMNQLQEDWNFEDFETFCRFIDRCFNKLAEDVDCEVDESMFQDECAGGVNGGGVAYCGVAY